MLLVTDMLSNKKLEKKYRNEGVKLDSVLS